MQKQERKIQMLENLKNYHIILASNSPRRRELFSALGLEFEIKTLPGIDENYPETLIGQAIPMHIAAHKAEAYRETMNENDLIITADTIVHVNNEVLGKPVDAEDARRMLHLLSNRCHEVITGVSLMTKDMQHTFAVTTNVTFDKLTDEEIDFYIEHYKPYDKAGSYGIQEWIGLVGVSKIEGSYFNVMGLPVQRLYKELQRF